MFDLHQEIDRLIENEKGKSRYCVLIVVDDITCANNIIHASVVSAPPRKELGRHTLLRYVWCSYCNSSDYGYNDPCRLAEKDSVCVTSTLTGVYSRQGVSISFNLSAIDCYCLSCVY